MKSDIVMSSKTGLNMIISFFEGMEDLIEFFLRRYLGYFQD